MAADGQRHVLAIGGTGGGAAEPPTGLPRLVSYALELSGRSAPRVCLVNTATGDDPRGLARQYSALAVTPARVTHLELFPMPNVADPEDLLLSQDVIFVGAAASLTWLPSGGYTSSTGFSGRPGRRASCCPG